MNLLLLSLLGGVFMDEFSITGFLKQCFINTTGRGKVANFSVKSSGYQTESGYKPVPPYKFETWMPELVEKIRGIPRESLVSVYFNIVPRKTSIEGKNIDVTILKANRVVHWDKAKKERSQDEDADIIQTEFRFDDSST